MADPRWFEIEVVYAEPQQQLLMPLRVVPGTTIQQAVAVSGIAAKFPAVDFTQLKVGIFGKLVSIDARVQVGDRVEIYHPLLLDPKTARQARAQRQRDKPVIDA